MHEINKKIIGTWKLVHSIEIDTFGNKNYPFGNDAIGYIVYDASGVMTVQISRKERSLFNSKNFVNSDSHDLLSLPKDYLAYFGRYEIDVKKELVRHFVQGHLFPNSMGEVLERKYHFFEDRMLLTPLEGTRRQILWQKC